MLNKLVQFFLPESTTGSNSSLKNIRYLIQVNLSSILVIVILATLQMINSKYLSSMNNFVAASLLIINTLYIKKGAAYSKTTFATIIIGTLLISMQHGISPENASYNLILIPIVNGFSFALLKPKRALQIAFFMFIAFTLAEYNRRAVGFATISLKPSDIATTTMLIMTASLFLSSFGISKLLSEQQRAENLYMERNSRNIELTKTNATMISILVHDIASPLSIIKLSCESARGNQENRSEKDLKTFDKIDENATRVISIIESIRQMKSMETGKLQVSLRPTSLASVTTDVIKTLSDLASKKGIQFNFHPSLENIQEFEVIADHNALGVNVLHNVISNAIKFSKRNSTIGIQFNKLSSGKIEIKIIDSGIGIPSEIIEDLFSSNKPTTRKGTENEHGTGFGMPIVKVFMDAFQGEIKVESSTLQDKSGTTITLVLHTEETLPTKNTYDSNVS